jgi:hypothetical protein
VGFPTTVFNTWRVAQPFAAFAKAGVVHSSQMNFAPMPGAPLKPSFGLSGNCTETLNESETEWKFKVTEKSSHSFANTANEWGTRLLRLLAVPAPEY